MGVEQYLDRLPHGGNALTTDHLPTFTLTRAGGFLPRIMGQHVFGYVTMLERNLLEARDFQNNREYAREAMIQFRRPQTVTVGILGLGDIGQGVGKMLKGAGYNVLGFKRRASSRLDTGLSACADYVTSDLETVLSQSDIIENVLPSTSATRYLLNKNNLKCCSEPTSLYQHRTWRRRRCREDDYRRFGQWHVVTCCI